MLVQILAMALCPSVLVPCPSVSVTCQSCIEMAEQIGLDFGTLPCQNPARLALKLVRSLPFLLQDWLHGFLELFTDSSERTRFLFFSFFLFFHFLVLSTYPTQCYKEIRVHPKMGVVPCSSFWNFASNSGLRKFRHGISIVKACYQLSWTKVSLRAW